MSHRSIRVSKHTQNKQCKLTASGPPDMHERTQVLKKLFKKCLVFIIIANLLLYKHCFHGKSWFAISGFYNARETIFAHFSYQNFCVENSKVVSYLLEASDSLKKSSLKSNNHIKLLLSSPPCSLRFLPPTTSTAPWARNTEFSKEI